MAGSPANLKGAISAFSAVLAYFFLYASKADMYIYLYLKPHKKGLFRYFFSFVSSLGMGEVLVFLIVVLCLLPVPISKRRGLFCRGILGLVAAGVCSSVIKVLIGRPRPSMLSYGYYWPHGPTFVDKFFSTPSGHTVAAFVLACILSSQFPKWRYLLVGTALMIGLSRVFLLYHYPSDIIISIFIGCVIGKWVSKLELPRFMEGAIDE
jgi:undecaprenyl-diphosphatase